MREMIKSERSVKMAIAAVLAAWALAAAACNTVSGAGRDLQEASDGTKRAITGDSK